MAETLSIVSKRVDDRPVLLAQLDRMGLQPLLDEHCPTHGHGVGLRMGWVSVLWLTHLLSEGAHRLNHVAPWATQRLHTLQACTGQPVHPLDVSDDRLATVLEGLRDETRWRALEEALNQHTWRVYDLQPACVRWARTTAHGHWRVTADGLCPCGHSTDQRPDLPQVTIMVSALEPLGMPVATDVVPGQRADDPMSGPCDHARPRAPGAAWAAVWGRWPDRGTGNAGLHPDGGRRRCVPIVGDPTPPGRRG
jgi:transposase